MTRDTSGASKLNVRAIGTTMKGFSEMLSVTLDRPVIDRTGVSGLFDIHLESAIEGTRLARLLAIPDTNEHPASVQPLPSIFAAIQDQLGLRLEASRAPVEVLVIDSIDRPTEN